MNSTTEKPRRQSLLHLAFAIVVFWFAPFVANLAANGLSSGRWTVLVFHSFLLFLYVAVFGGMGSALDRQPRPYEAMGLALRPGWGEEITVGAAVGWGLAVVVVGIIALDGGLRVGFDRSAGSWELFSINLMVLLLASLVEEVAFRGYAFQRLIELTGPVTAVLIASLAFGLKHAANPNATPQSVAVAVLAGILFSVAYLRTRALWLGWGLHFAWNFALGVVFGLPVSGMWQFSTVVQSRARGPLWLTGGGYGPEASFTAAVVLFAGIWILVRVTRDYAWRYAQPKIVAGGMPVDIGGHPAVPVYPPVAAVATDVKPADENGLIQIQLK